MHVLWVIVIAVMWLVWESAVHLALSGSVDMSTAFSVQLDLPLCTISQPAMTVSPSRGHRPAGQKQLPFLLSPSPYAPF